MISWPLSGLGGAEKAALMQDGGRFWFLLTHSGLLQGQIR